MLKYHGEQNSSVDQLTTFEIIIIIIIIIIIYYIYIYAILVAKSLGACNGLVVLLRFWPISPDEIYISCIYIYIYIYAYSPHTHTHTSFSLFGISYLSQPSLFLTSLFGRIVSRLISSGLAPLAL